MNAELRRILILSYHFPPDGAIGGMRWAGFSKHLARLGWDVHVVTASPQAGTIAVPGVHVHVRPRRTTLNDVYNSAARRFKGGASASASAPSAAPVAGTSPPLATPAGGLRRVVTAIRRNLADWLTLPDVGRGWMLRAALASRALLRAQPFDVVISSGPPHSSHLAALLATFGRREPVFIDMRDPWSETVATPTARLTTRLLVPLLERFVRKRIRMIVVTTPEFAATLRLGEPWLRIAYVSNGVDVEQLPAKVPAPENGCVISHVGTLYGGRNLNMVVEAMREVVRAQPAARQALRLHIVGNIDESHQGGLEASLALDSIGELVQFHGAVPRAAALGILNASHLALVLAQDQHLMIPAKLYESVALDIPTVTVAELTSAAARESVRVGAITVGINDVAAMRRVIEDMLARRVPTRSPPAASISHAALAAQFDELFRARLRTP